MIYTTVIHFLRRAYCLSLNEYCVLDAIQTLSGNSKFDGWCIASQQHIANELDLSRDTIQRAYTTLEEKGLIQRRKNLVSDTGVRPSAEWLEVRNADKEDMVFILEKNGIKIGAIPQKFNNVTLTAKTDRVPEKPTGGYRKIRQGVTAKTDTIITSDNNKYINTTNVADNVEKQKKEPTRIYRICRAYYKAKLGKELDEENPGIVKSFVSRNARSAKLLEPYPDDKIKMAIKHVRELSARSYDKGDGQGWDWSLETVLKKIDSLTAENSKQYE